MTQFFVNKGLVAVGLIAKFSFVFWLLSGMGIVLQAVTIWLIFTLNSKHFASPMADTLATPAE